MQMLSLKASVRFLSCLAIILPLLGLSEHLGMNYRAFYKLPGHVLVGNVTATLKVKGFSDCAFHCLEHGPFACQSFNFDNTQDNGYYTCEISNSERYLEPLRIQERQGYDYYGTTTKDLFRLLPCTRSPCYYGGTCVHGPLEGEFSCQCAMNSAVIPFDKRCNVDFAVLFTSKPVQGVFHAAGLKRYSQNYYDAQRLCEIYGAALATYNQLYAAWEAGLNYCALAWLVDGTVRYPMCEIKESCGNGVGIMGTSAPQDKNVGKYNAWCYKQ